MYNIMFDFFRYSNVWIAIYEDKSVCHLEFNKIIHEVIVLENVFSISWMYEVKSKHKESPGEFTKEMLRVFCSK